MRKNIMQFTICIVKPNRRHVALQSVKAKDSAWRTAIFGMGGSSVRIAGARIGTVDKNPIAIIGQLPEQVPDGTPVWTIKTDDGLYAFAGPCAVFNDAGFGPAHLGISRAKLTSIIEFDPDPVSLAAGLKKTIESRTAPDDA